MFSIVICLVVKCFDRCRYLNASHGSNRRHRLRLSSESDSESGRCQCLNRIEPGETVTHICTVPISPAFLCGLIVSGRGPGLQYRRISLCRPGRRRLMAKHGPTRTCRTAPDYWPKPVAPGGGGRQGSEALRPAGVPDTVTCGLFKLAGVLESCSSTSTIM